jgi:hypothetical protein
VIDTIIDTLTARKQAIYDEEAEWVEGELRKIIPHWLQWLGLHRPGPVTKRLFDRLGIEVVYTEKSEHWSDFQRHNIKIMRNGMVVSERP